MLRKSDKHIRPNIINYQDLEIFSDVSVEEWLIQIFDKREQVMRGKVILEVKVY